MNIPGKKIIKPAIIAAIGMFILILIRVGIDQIQWYGIAVERIKSGDEKGAIMYFDRVLNAHIPFSPLEEKARSYLLNFASEFENKNEHELALLCYETIRSSQYLTGSFYLPFSTDIPFLNERIATLKTHLLVGARGVDDPGAEYRHQMEVLRRNYSPTVVLPLTTIFCFIAFIVAVVAWLMNEKKGYLFISLLFLVLWMVALHGT